MAPLGDTPLGAPFIYNANQAVPLSPYLERSACSRGGAGPYEARMRNPVTTLPPHPLPENGAAIVPMPCRLASSRQVASVNEPARPPDDDWYTNAWR